MKKSFFLLITVSLSFQFAVSQNVGVNATGTVPRDCAMLDVLSSTTGLLIPNLALTATNAYAPATGTGVTSLLVYNTATVGASTSPTAVVPGFYYWDVASAKWIALAGNGSKSWALLGNAGTTVGTNFLGTTDNVDLMFKVNNVKGGLIDIANNQTHFGYAAGLNNTAAGTLTSFFGVGAGQGNTSGTGNTGVGYDALVTNQTATDNTAVGVQALFSTIGNGNVAIGTNAGYSITSGTNNTALGTYAMNNGVTTSITGSYNVAAGYNAMSKSTSAGYNAAYGFSAMLNNSTGSDNVAMGTDALYYFGTASYNTGLGDHALEGSGTVASNTGIANSALGYCAGGGYGAFPVSNVNINNLPITTGSYNTFLGYATDMSAGTYSNTTTVGSFAQAGANDVLILGSIAGTNFGQNQVNVGIGTTTPTNQFHNVGSINASLGYSNNSNASGRGFRADNTAASGAGTGGGMMGNTVQSGGYGVSGNNTNANGTGVWGSGNNLGYTYILTNASGGSFSGQYNGAFGYVKQNAVGASYSGGYNGVFGRADAANNTASNASRYHFGTYGEKDQDVSAYFYDYRSGGVLGVGYRLDNLSIQSWGSLGYKSSGGNDYGVYGGTGLAYTGGAGGGRMSSGNNTDMPTIYLQGIGGGLFGSLMGSWSSGELMGSTSYGSLYANYNMGNAYTSGYSADIVTTKNNTRAAAYSMTSADLKVYGDGFGTLANGRTHVNYSSGFTQLIASGSKPVVTITPNGNCNGVYIENITAEGFDVVELNSGHSNVEFSWIAIGKRVDAKDNMALPSDLSDVNFETNMKNVMFDELNPNKSASPIWYDGFKLRFDSGNESFEKNFVPAFPVKRVEGKPVRLVEDGKVK